MPLKGRIDPDHIPLNKYKLLVLGIGEITATNVSGLETEVAAIDLPDRTKASGGQISATEFTVTVPMHHSAEIALMDLWFNEGQDPIAVTYKKPGTLQHLSGTGDIQRIYALTGMWVQKSKLPDLAYDDDGWMAEVEYTLCADSATVLPV